MRRWKATSWGLIGIAAVALTACGADPAGPLASGSTGNGGGPGGTPGDAGGPGGGVSTSSVTVLLTDAPNDLVHAWVDIREVYLQGGPDSGGRTVLLDQPTGLIDVLPLASQAMTLIQSVDIPSGKYAQLRIVIGGLAIETEGGEVLATKGTDVPGGLTPTGEIKCPSCDTSGFKVGLQGFDDLSLLSDAVLTVDFDAAQTFVHQAGNSGKWVVKPVLKLSDFVTVGD